MENNLTLSASPARLPVFSLFTANAVSSVGTVMTQLALPWFVLQTTGSAAKTGLVSFFVILPTVFAAFVGGPLVDRLGFRRSSILADCACTVTIALIPLLYIAGMLEFWALLALVFFASLFDTPGLTARTALLPTLALKANMTLEQASTGTQVINRSARLVGAPLAGLLIAWLGATQVLWLDAATFAFSAALIALAVPARQAKAVAEGETREPGGPFWKELVGGLTFIWQDRLLRIIVGVVMITNMLDGALMGVVLPLYTKTFLGQAFDLGLLVAISGGGSVVGALIFAAFSTKLPQRELVIGGFMVASLAFLVLALTPPFWVILLIFAVEGIAAGPLNPILVAVLYGRTPEKNLGKVLGALTAGVNVVTPVGILAAGFLLEQVDIRLVLAGMWVMYFGVVSILGVSRSVREIGRKEQ